MYPVEIPFGPRNYFRPASADQNQPTVFAPGRTLPYPDAAFRVEFHGNRIVWRLDGRSATASRSSQACASITQP